MPTQILVVASLLLMALSACNKSHVQTVEAYAGSAMARPDRVLVSYFTTTPGQVQLDQGVGARLQRAAGSQPETEQDQQAAEATQAALAEDLVERLRSYGLPADFATGGPTGAPTGEPSLLIEGQIVGINQGNRTRRLLVGLGAGKSSVTADMQLYYAAPNTPRRFMTAFQGEADSGHMPGAVETMGAGAAGQRLATSAAVSGATHGSAERRRAPDTAEAANLADGLAKQIGGFAVSQGWLPASAVQ